VLFNSYVFLFAFLPLVLAGWWGLRRDSHRLFFLTVASYVFYSWFDFPTGLKLLPLLVASTTIDYIAGLIIHRSSVRRVRGWTLAAALGSNLLLLGVFKYLGFFERSADALLSLIGGGNVPIHHLILPIGISFYTFNSMSYTIDIYRGRVQPARSVLEYSAFVALFPHLIAGPIVRYSDIADQLRALKHRFTGEMAALGAWFFICGLFKKVVVADAVAPTVDRLYAHSEHLTFVSGWAAAFGYSMQLYFDFSAYSDMAVGLAMLMGLRFPQNFNSPYVAVNIQDFWNRWHITLSRWLRDYLYIPLGGSHGGKGKTLRNLFITMFLGGLWHGAAAVFVLWGMGHGALLVIHRLAADRGLVPPWRWLSRALTFLAVTILWVPFRSGAQDVLEAGSSFDVAGNVLRAMAGMNGLGYHNLSHALTTGDAVGAAVPLGFGALIAGLLVWVNVAPNTWQARFAPTPFRAVVLAAMATWAIMSVGKPSPFLYFQF
jgi:alginate O-acetyltransferase complex protein AlgI